MEILAGWKDILRPIRDGYRHLFPTPDTGPTPEERARQRELDRLKGFAYFDTVDQLEKWVEADTDPLQRANTPLLPRSRTQNGANELKASVLICHDYAGNYHDHEAVQSIGVDEESYSCEYLQFVDSFIYFSHKLVCVPPPTWINTLHRNGVRALGTLIVEPQTKDAERLLHHVVTTGDSTCDQGDGFYFPMARKLATIAGHVGFDGWLINIEKSFPKEQWDAVTLKLFLQHLRRYLGPERRLVW
jgi:endo-beta-N-acetylglucosaminidase D